jgi:hypothetical protein
MDSLMICSQELACLALTGSNCGEMAFTSPYALVVAGLINTHMYPGRSRKWGRETSAARRPPQNASFSFFLKFPYGRSGIIGSATVQGQVSGLGQQLTLLSVAFEDYPWLLSHCQIVVPYAVSKAGITSPF